MISIVKAQEIIKDLSIHFEVIEPRIRFGRVDSNRCFYYPNSNLISLTKKHDSYDCVLHEFTHALVKKEGGIAITHGDMFSAELLRVVDYYYKGNLKKYSWRWEYLTIKQFYDNYMGWDNQKLELQNTGNNIGKIPH